MATVPKTDATRPAGAEVDAHAPSWLSIFLRKVWAILVETVAHPRSLSVIQVRDGRVRRHHYWGR